MSHKFRFPIIAALVLLAMFAVPHVTMAASLHSVTSTHVGVQSSSLHKGKPCDKKDHKDFDNSQDDSSSWQPQDSESVSPSTWHRSPDGRIIVIVHIRCSFFSCNIHSFNGNEIVLPGEPPMSGAAASGAAASGAAE